MLAWRGAACLLLSKHRDPPWLLSSFRLRMSGNLQQQRAAVEQLRREANIKRISVSQAVEDNPGVSLVVVDSVASLVRSEGELRSGLDRGRAVHRLGQSLLQLTSTGLAVLAVNQVSARLSGAAGRDLCGRGLVASLGQVWEQYPHTRLWLSKTRYVVSRTASSELQGLMAETRLRTLHVDWSCRLPNTLTHFLVDTKGCHGVKIQN